MPRGTIRERRVCRSLRSRRGLTDRSWVSGRTRVTGRALCWAGSRVKGRSVWAVGIVGFGPTEGFSSGCRIWLSARLRPLRLTAYAIFRRPLSLLDNVVSTSFFHLFSSIPEIILHPNPVFGIDFVCKDLTLPDLEKLGSPPFCLSCRWCSP